MFRRRLEAELLLMWTHVLAVQPSALPALSLPYNVRPQTACSAMCVPPVLLPPPTPLTPDP